MQSEMPAGFCGWPGGGTGSPNGGGAPGGRAAAGRPETGAVGAARRETTRTGILLFFGNPGPRHYREKEKRARRSELS